MIQNHPFSSQGRIFSLNGSIGICIWDEKTHYKDLVARADTACYIAKERGTGQIAHSNDVDNQHEELQSNMNWAAKIPQMLQQDRFVLFYQKMENLQNPSAPTGHAEILIRGIDEEGKIVPPGFFLPAAERFHLINRIDRWVAQSILKQQLPANMLYAINRSGPSLADHAFLQSLVEWVKASHLPSTHVCFEITETAAMTDMDSAKLFISTLKALGCRFALDDFGSGFSSFSYLKDLDVDYLKIDGSMIRNLERNESDVALVTAIIQMAKALKLCTIAEFVENDIQKEILCSLGVDYAQGYAIHKPEALPISDPEK
ncbi:EAL domain-containing protein [Deefgea tanakiae]|uniref:EAL domain-containing protein n=2 Tax=Deefgea tanakiae TaxID=2865840 RepID=A0ABX8Z672_9NEIS|nr:EAL domain-containing protein [Deefgea tanakiae]